MHMFQWKLPKMTCTIEMYFLIFFFGSIYIVTCFLPPAKLIYCNLIIINVGCTYR